MTKTTHPSLTLHVPEQRAVGVLHSKLQIHKPQSWFDDLPTGNIGEMARRLYDALTEINRVKMPWKTRLRLLEQFRRPLNDANEVLDTRYLGQALPLSDRMQRVATLVRVLNDEMAIGYKAAIIDFYRDKFRWLHRAALAQMLARALYYQALVMLNHYRLYTQPDTRLWDDIHGVYQLALLSKVSGSSVDDELSATSTRQIEGLYLRILLFAMAAPNGLRQKEITCIFDILPTLTDDVRLGPVTEPLGASSYLFVVSSHREPRHIALYKDSDGNHTNKLLLLNTQALAERIDAQSGHFFAALALGNNDRSTHLHDRLMLSWGIPGKRASVRETMAAAQQADVVIGLSDIHRILSYAHVSSHSPALNETLYRAEYHSQPVKSLNDQAPDVWEFRNLIADPRLSNTPSSKNNHDLPPVYVMSLLDESTAGGRLAYDKRAYKPGKNPTIKIGDLLAVWPHNDKPDRSSIGVIRWIHNEGNDHIELGLQTLTHRPMAVVVRPLGATPSASGFSHALLIENMAHIHKGSTLLTAGMNFHEQDELELFTYTKNYIVKLINKTNNTGIYSEFSVLRKTAEGHKPNTQPSAALNAHEDAEFHKVWSEIS